MQDWLEHRTWGRQQCMWALRNESIETSIKKDKKYKRTSPCIIIEAIAQTLLLEVEIRI